MHTCSAQQLAKEWRIIVPRRMIMVKPSASNQMTDLHITNVVSPTRMQRITASVRTFRWLQRLVWKKRNRRQRIARHRRKNDGSQIIVVNRLYVQKHNQAALFSRSA